jgi:hypothetical protein
VGRGEPLPFDVDEDGLPPVFPLASVLEAPGVLEGEGEVVVMLVLIEDAAGANVGASGLRQTLEIGGSDNMRRVNQKVRLTPTNKLSWYIMHQASEEDTGLP